MKCQTTSIIVERAKTSKMHFRAICSGFLAVLYMVHPSTYKQYLLRNKNILTFVEFKPNAVHKSKFIPFF